MTPSGWKKKLNAQRVHLVEERNGNEIWIQLNTSPEKYDSDEYAGLAVCGDRVAQGDIVGAKKGKDGVMPSGQIIAEQRWKSCKVKHVEKDGSHGIRLIIEAPDAFFKKDAPTPLLMLNAAELFQPHAHVAARVGSIERFFTPLNIAFIRTTVVAPSRTTLILSFRVYSRAGVSHLLARLKPGDSIYLRPAEDYDPPSCSVGELAKAAFLPQKFRRIVLLAAGSGIVPLFNVCQSVLSNTPDTVVTLMCFDKNPEYALARDLLAKFALNNKSRVAVIRAFSDLTSNGAVLPGEAQVCIGTRFGQDFLNTHFSCTMSKGEDRILFSWCGPLSFCDAVPSVLRKCGFDDTQNAFFVPFVG